MSRTIQEVITSARGTVNDDAADRYTDAEAIGFVIDALNATRSRRSDLFIGHLTENFGPYTTTDVLPIDDQYFRPIVDYVIARFETKDDEAVLSGRAQLMIQIAAGELS